MNKNNRIIHISGIRKLIAERMFKSYHEIPHVTLMIKVNLKKIMDLKKIYLEKNITPFSFTDIVIYASSNALKSYPLLNAHFENGNIIIKDEINIGIAVNADQGIIVPVIKNVENMTFQELIANRKQLINKAVERRITPDELSGGTFTITNLGNFGIETFNPIINFPEVAILGVGQIQDEPVVINNFVVIRPVFRLCLSFDHRIIDGVPGANFLNTVKELLQEPKELLNNIL